MKPMLKWCLCGAAVLMTAQGFAQGTTTKPKELPKGWHLLGKEKDGVYGLDMNKAFEFVKGKKSKPVIVAVIDSGIDSLHEDLKDILWVNPKEIPGNGIDDDKNGYIDDVHGWNFLGGKDGRNVKEDSYEATRVYHKFKDKYDGKQIDVATLSDEDKYLYNMWLRSKEKVAGESAGGGADVMILRRAYNAAAKNDSLLKVAMGKDVYTGKELDSYAPPTQDLSKAKAGILYMFKANNMLESTNKEFLEGFNEYLNGEERKKNAVSNPPPNYRGDIVKDDESDINDRSYGNKDIMASTPFHGTHVSGIVGAIHNGKGMNGVSDNVRIMTVRAVPDGDEHDKDIALAIRYAVDNGARVVNMSFGKGFSPEKKWVDDAVKYAESKNVLLIHAAGNDAQNIDSTENYPNANYLDTKTKAGNWITVGASSDPAAEGFKSYTASFSNYGKKEVDVFAPGTKIYSTIPGTTTYGNAQGTSMASPVVAGLAAFILNYYPNLSARQVKYVIEKSVVKLDEKVKKPGTNELVDMSELCTSGGVVNAYNAIKLASTLKPESMKKLKSSLKKGVRG